MLWELSGRGCMFVPNKVDDEEPRIYIDLFDPFC